MIILVYLLLHCITVCCAFCFPVLFRFFCFRAAAVIGEYCVDYYDDNYDKVHAAFLRIQKDNKLSKEEKAAALKYDMCHKIQADCE